MLIDSHTHVQFAAYDEDREEVIRRALEKEIGMVNVGTQYSTSKGAIELAEKYPEGLWATVGFHPLNIEKTYNDPQEAPEVGQETFDVDALRELANHSKVVAIGECGLDYYRIKNKEARMKQQEVFRQQIELAEALGKPLVIHCRAAFPDLFTILDSYFVIQNSFTPRGVVHFFSGTIEDAKKLQRLGFFVSFGGVITFVDDYSSLVAQVPLEQILVETDAPYVAPVPYRGKRNEPTYVEEVAKKVAEIKGFSLDEVEARTTVNAHRLFQFT